MGYGVTCQPEVPCQGEGQKRAAYGVGWRGRHSTSRRCFVQENCCKKFPKTIFQNDRWLVSRVQTILRRSKHHSSISINLYFAHAANRSTARSSGLRKSVAFNTPRMWFGTRGSEVQILSSRPFSFEQLGRSF